MPSLDQTTCVTTAALFTNRDLSAVHGICNPVTGRDEGSCAWLITAVYVQSQSQPVSNHANFYIASRKVSSHYMISAKL